MNVARNALDSIKALLPGVAEQTAKVHDSLQVMRKRMRDLAAEREGLMALPLAPQDVVGILHAQIDREANAYRDKASAALCRALVIEEPTKRSHEERYKPAKKVSDAARLVADLKPLESSMLGGFRGPREFAFGAISLDGGGEALTAGAATFLFRDEMKRAAAEIVAAMRYPFSAAKSLSLVQARVAEIDAELAGIRTSHDELEEQARELGISIPEYIDPDANADAVVAGDGFDATGWTAGQTDGEGGVLLYYRWTNSDDKNYPSGVDWVVRRDARDGTEGVVPYNSLPDRVKRAMGAPHGYAHLPQFNGIR